MAIWLRDDIFFLFFLPFQHNFVSLILLFHRRILFALLHIGLLTRPLKKKDLPGAFSLTFVAQQTLPSVRAEAHGLQRRLGDARGSVTAGVALAGAELAQPAGVERGALAEPVLAVAA